MRRILKSILLALIAVLVSVRPALAYIDPNTGGLLFQILAASFAVISGALLIFSRQIRMAVARLRRLLSGRRDESPGSAPQEAEQIDPEEGA